MALWNYTRSLERFRPSALGCFVMDTPGFGNGSVRPIPQQRGTRSYPIHLAGR